VQARADADEKFHEDGVLVRKVPVHGRAADTDGRAEVFESHTHESAFGDQPCGGVQELTSTVGLHLIASRRSCYLLRGHSLDLSSLVFWTTQLIIVNLVSVIEH